jgi:hypothetical protein
MSLDMSLKTSTLKESLVFLINVGDRTMRGSLISDNVIYDAFDPSLEILIKSF